MTTCTVYGLRSSRDGVIRYIGQTTQALEKRLDAHLNPRKGTRYRVSFWIRRERADGFKIEIIPLDTNATWNETEVRTIAEYRARGVDLVNCSPGGDGNLGRVCSDAQKAAVSAAQKGRVKSPEHRAKLAAANRGKPISPETRAKIAAALKGRRPKNLDDVHARRAGRPLSAETRAKLSAALKGRQVTSTETLLRNLGRIV